MNASLSDTSRIRRSLELFKSISSCTLRERHKATSLEKENIAYVTYHSISFLCFLISIADSALGRLHVRWGLQSIKTYPDQIVQQELQRVSKRCNKSAFLTPLS